jgi:hypothetical protein
MMRGRKSIYSKTAELFPMKKDEYNFGDGSKDEELVELAFAEVSGKLHSIAEEHARV